MSPNLFVIASKALKPWIWYKRNVKQKPKIGRKLHFSHEPVPGIYAITPDNKRYLVALRPNGKTDDEHIFRDLTSKENIRLQSTKSVNRIDPSRQTLNDDGTKNILQFPEEITERFYSPSTANSDLASGDRLSSEEMYHNCPDGIQRQSSTLSSIISSTHAIKSTASVTDSSDSQAQGTLPFGCNSRNTSALSLSSQSSITPSTRAVHSVVFATENNSALPLQNLPYGRKTMNTSSLSLSNLGFDKKRYAIHGLEKVDLIGYKFLRRPLQIEYCDIMGRWMFSSEIHARKIAAPMCKNINCMKTDMSRCSNTTEMDLFCLDDSQSWVLIGKTKYRHTLRRAKQHWCDAERLYYIDEKTDCIRRQTVEEVKSSRLRLAREKGRFVVVDDRARYMPVVRYLEARDR